VRDMRYKLSVVAAVLLMAGIAVSLLVSGRGRPAGATFATVTPTVTSTEITYGEVGVVLQPPASSFDAKVSGTEAEQVAVGDTKATVVSAVGGLYSNTQAVTDTGKLRYDGVPVWIVTVDGVCSPYWGPHPEADGPCYYALRHIVVDAATGEVLENFS